MYFQRSLLMYINYYNGTGTNVNDTIFYNDQDAQLSNAGDYYIIELQVSNPIGSFDLHLKENDNSWLYPSIFNGGPIPAKFDSNNIMIVNDIIEDFN